MFSYFSRIIEILLKTKVKYKNQEYWFGSQKGPDNYKLIYKAFNNLTPVVTISNFQYTIKILLRTSA